MLGHTWYSPWFIRKTRFGYRWRGRARWREKTHPLTWTQADWRPAARRRREHTASVDWSPNWKIVSNSSVIRFIARLDQLVQLTWTPAVIRPSHSSPRVLSTHTEQEMQQCPPQSSLEQQESESKGPQRERKYQDYTCQTSDLGHEAINRCRQQKTRSNEHNRNSTGKENTPWKCSESLNSLLERSGPLIQTFFYTAKTVSATWQNTAESFILKLKKLAELQYLAEGLRGSEEWGCLNCCVRSSPVGGST